MTRMFIFSALILFTAACTAGTATQQASPRENPPTSPGGGSAQLPPVLGQAWSMDMVQSGGMMGLLRSIQITSDGQVLVVDERAGRMVDSRLSVAEMDQLKKLISETKYIPPTIPTLCADCFVYDVTIESAGNGAFVVQVDDIAIDDSGMKPLVLYLRVLLENALKSQP